MNKQSSLLTAIMLATAAITSAQDSVSKTAGLPGDAVDAYATGEQINDYVVDLVDFTTSWGTNWGIAPLVKSSKGDTLFFNNGISSQYTSTTLRSMVTPPRANYSLWTAAGGGVNDSSVLNNPGTSTLPPASSTQFAMSFAEFGFGNHVVTAVANFDPLAPSRMFVTRVQSALNGMDELDVNVQIGLGAVDADGNTYFRGDDFGVAGTNQVVGNNIYRVDALARNGAVSNIIGGTGPADAGATDWLVNSSGTTHNTPGCVPADVAGRPIYRGSNFGAMLAYESSPNVVTNTSLHLAGTGSSDHRGNVGYSNAVIFPGSLGTSTLYAKNSSSETRNLLFFGTSSSGSVVGTHSLPIPGPGAGVVTDNSTGFTWPETGDAVGEFIHGSSQVAFRGGNGQVAVGKDQAGRGLVAAVAVSDDALAPIWFTENPQNALLVARFDPANITGTVAWTTVAYTDNVGVAGKEILDGPGGTAIGQIVWMDTATGGAAVGPSISNPMIDSVGNVWFTAGVELFGSPSSDFDTALLRGVYNPASFSYELELVLELGSTFRGANSDRDWQIQFIGVADSNSIASGAPHSNNMVQSAFNNMSTTGLATTDSEAMGGMVLNVGLVYDWDDDGTFDTAGGFDQNYTAVLYLGHTTGSCSSLPETYCTAGTTANGCQAALSTVGTASATATSGFTVTATNVEGNKDGLFFLGTNGRQAQPWGNGTSFQCVVPPVNRLTLLPGNGTNNMCDGTKVQDFNALWCPTCPKPAKNPGSGAVVQAQLWFRDPLNTSNQTTSFSDAIEFTVCP